MTENVRWRETQHGGKIDDACICREPKFPAGLGCPDPERSDRLCDRYHYLSFSQNKLKWRKC